MKGDPILVPTGLICKDGSPLMAHSVEMCDCDECRFRRYEMTLKVETVTINHRTGSFEEFARSSLAQYHQALQAFLEAEEAGQVVAPSGPFTKENGWDVYINTSADGAKLSWLRWVGVPNFTSEETSGA